MSNYYRPSGIGGFSFFPPVIKNLLIINGAIFFILVIMQNIKIIDGIPAWYIINKWFALNPLDGLDAAGKPYNFQVWQLLTYQFMHYDFFHILFNMFSLWMFGMEVENLWGSKKFLYFYLLCGVAAGIIHLFLSPLFGGAVGQTVGASGAIYGVLIAFGLIFPNKYIIYFFIPVKAKYLITVLIIMEFTLINSADSNIARLAHLGGALAGFIFVMLDKETHVPLKDIFRRSSYRTNKPFNPFGNVSEKFKKKQPDVREAKFYEVDHDEEITQEEIDKILDKISESGYQNLTEREKKVLFEASKKMK